MAQKPWDRVNPWRGLAGLPREVWVLSAATLVNKAGAMVLPFLAIYLTRQLHFPLSTAGFVMTLYGAAALVAAPVSGRLSDRYGPIRIMRISLIASGVVMLVFPLAKSLTWVCTATVALSLIAEAFRPANLTIFGDLVRPEQRKAAFALNRLAINLGMSMGPAIGGVLATVSFRSLFWVNGAASLAGGAILVASKFPESRLIAQEHEIGESLGTRPRLASPGHLDRRLLFFLAGMLPVAIVFFQHMSSMPLYLVRDLHFSEAMYGLLFTVNTLLIVFLEVKLNTATAHWPHARTLALGAILCGLGFGALAFATDTRAVIATVVVWTLGEMFFFPGMAAYLTDIAPVERRGEYMGLSQMVMGLAFTIGPWAGTAILARFGGRALWLATLALGAAAGVWMSQLKQPRARASDMLVPAPTTAPSTEP
jgi:predicted MFS family arabinose efflux permease